MFLEEAVEQKNDFMSVNNKTNGLFESVEEAAPDAVFGVVEAFKADPSQNKINLSIGMYADESGEVPTLRCVKEAEKRILNNVYSAGYLGIAGTKRYARVVSELVFGADHELVESRRAACAHTPSGTAALRVGSELISNIFPDAVIWVPNKTWANHGAIFRAAKVETNTYPYFDVSTGLVCFEKMLEGLTAAKPGDVVLLHGCCHNPTGADLNDEQWLKVAEVIHERGLLPFIDFAYQGLARNLDADRSGIMALCEGGHEALIASSFSKNMSLYNGRVGALIMVAPTSQKANAILSHAKKGYSLSLFQSSSSWWKNC